MAIAIRGTTPLTSSGTGDPTSLTLTGTRQPNTNDILIIIHCNDFYLHSNIPTPTVGGSSTGVTAVTNGDADGGSDHAHAKSFWFKATSTADLTVAVDETGTADEEKCLIVYVLSGADGTTPIDVAANSPTIGPTSPHPAPSVSPSSSDAFLICHVNNSGGADAGPYTPPSGMAESYDVSVGGAMTATGATLQLASSGATGAKDFTPTSTATSSSLSIAVKTASAGDATASPAVIARSFTVPAVTSAGQIYPVSHVSTGTVATATSGASNPITCSPAYPGSGATGDLAVLTIVSKHDTEATPTVTAGGGETWTSRGSASGGGGTYGAGTGPMRITWFTHEMASASPAAPTVNLAGTDTGRTLQAVLTIVRKTTGSFDIASAFGAETTAGTGWSQATTSDPGITVDDLLLIGYGVRDDQHAGFSAMGVTATSATIAAVDERADAVTGNGNDQGLGLGSCLVTAGTGTAAPVVTGTIGSSESGEVGVLRIRATSADATASPAVIARSFAAPAAAAGVGAAPAVIARAFVTPAAVESVGAAPAVITRSFTTPQATAVTGAVAAPAVVPLVVALPQATATESTTTTPAVIARSFTTPQPLVGVGAAPSVIATAVTIPQTGAGVGAAPAVIVRAFTLPQAIGGSATVAEPAVIDRAFALPQPLVGVGAAPAVITRTLALPQAAAGVGAAPAVLAAVVAMPQWTVSSSAGPDTAPAVIAVPQATADTGGAAGTATPAVIARVFTVPQSVVSIAAAPAVFTVAFTVPQPAESVGAAPLIIAQAFALPQPSVGVGAAPLVIARAFTIPAVSTAGATNVEPAAIVAVSTLPQAAVGVGVLGTVIARVFTLPQATNPGAGDITSTPAAIVRSFTTPQAAVSVGVLGTVIARVFTVPQASAGGSIDATPAVVARLFVLPQTRVGVGAAPAVILVVATVPELASAGSGVFNAQSVYTLTAGRTSIAVVTAGRTSVAPVTAGRTSASTVTD